MDSLSIVIFTLEIIGTVAFACSGAMVGIHSQMDIFGVLVMAITTAAGGGIIRDLILGITPPGAFTNPVYVAVAVICALILFAIIYVRRQIETSRIALYYERLMAIMDALGLGIFTVLGIDKAYAMGYSGLFLLIFVGVVTGVGGGVLRDVMAQKKPYIFVKHIYACASIVGAVFCVCLMETNRIAAILGGAVLVVVIRFLAAHYRWNLPKIIEEDSTDQKS